MKKLEETNSSASAEWIEITRTVDLCLRLLAVPSATAETTEPNEAAEQSRACHVLLSHQQSTKSLAAASLENQESPVCQKWSAEQVLNWFANNGLEFLLFPY